MGILLIGVDSLFKKFNLRSLNIVLLGLFIGYLLATALLLVLGALVSLLGLHPSHYIVDVAKIFLFLFATYVGVLMTLRSANELSVSIPFIHFTPDAHSVKKMILDPSALSDLRVVELALSGLLDQRLVLPRFLLKELYEEEESSDELTNYRAKRSLEVIKKLEAIPDLGIQYQDTDFLDIKELSGKIARLARLLNADLLSADTQRTHIEGIRIINIHALSNALKPLMQKGELMKIKIQRQGKEERQGVGYLEDGTMVVVNGGGDFIGKTITAFVLSVKTTTSGRIIFCNLSEEEGDDQE